MSESTAKIKTFIEQTLLPKGTAVANEREPLFSSGLIDSLSVLELIAFLEKNFSVTIDTRKHELKEFDSLESIQELLSRLHAPR